MVNQRTQWVAIPTNQTLESDLKTRGFTRMYQGAYLHPDVQSDFNFHLSQKMKKWFSVYFTYVRYGNLREIPSQFETKKITNDQYLVRYGNFKMGYQTDGRFIKILIFEM